MYINSIQTSTGLFSHLKSCSSLLYRFFVYLKDRAPDVPITREEQDMAAARIPLTPAKEAEIANQMDNKQENIKTAFLRQQESSVVMSHL